MKNRILKYCFSFIIILFIGSCSVKKNTGLSRAYHNLTSHYNAYFNGRDAHKQGVKKTDKSIVDNFTLIIPVFPHSSPDAVNGSRGDMDKAKTLAEMANLSLPLEKVIEMPEVQNLMGKEIKAHLKGKFGGYEIPRKFHFITEDFTLDNGMLTQTFKLKRRHVLEKYGEKLEELYK